MRLLRFWGKNVLRLLRLLGHHLRNYSHHHHKLNFLESDLGIVNPVQKHHFRLRFEVEVVDLLGTRRCNRL